MVNNDTLPYSLEMKLDIMNSVQVSGLRIAGGATRKGVMTSSSASNLASPPFSKGGGNAPAPAPDSGYDILEGNAG